MTDNRKRVVFNVQVFVQNAAAQTEIALLVLTQFTCAQTQTPSTASAAVEAEDS